MSTAVFPTLKGRGFDLTRTPVWSNSVEQFVSGKELRINNGWTYPRYQWDLIFNFLRSASAYTEFQTLLGFYNQRNGSYDSFLYTDTDDNAVTSQTIGVGDGVKTTFLLVRAFGGYIEPVFAPNVISNIYLNAVNQPSGWTASYWGSANPGIITFTTPPGAGVVVSATFSYYFPCRFADDKLSFVNFMNQLYECKKLSFLSIK